MTHSLPPLNGLRAFEAAARHLSFQKAAEELFVTPGAISQQIKKLEEILQVSLFSRKGRAVALTETGNLLLPGLSDGFDRLNRAVQGAIRHRELRHITVSVTPSFAGKWLVPRLENWTNDHPEIDIRISASLQIADFGLEGVDIAVRFGSGEYEGLDSTLLLPESFTVVCSPNLAGGAHRLESPVDLSEHNLLHVGSSTGIPGDDWRQWLKAAGVENIDVSHGLTFNDTAIAILAAISGQGVLLARRVLVEEDIAAGRLITPFAIDLPLDFAWYVVAPPANLERPEIAAFREWLLAEARQSDT